METGLAVAVKVGEAEAVRTGAVVGVSVAEDWEDSSGVVVGFTKYKPFKLRFPRE